MRELYLRFLHWATRRELRLIADMAYPISRKALIRYHDFMGIECVNCNTPTEDRLLSICMSTVKCLEDRDRG